MSILTAKRYAKTLFDLSTEQKQLESVHADFENLKKLLESSPELTRFIQNPIIPQTQQKQIITSLFKDKLSAMTFNFLLFLSLKRRLSLLNVMMDQFEDFYLEEKGVMKVSVITREALDEQSQNSILAHLKKKNQKDILPSWQIDPDILGGFKIQSFNRIEDYSLRSQLDQFEQKLIDS